MKMALGFLFRHHIQLSVEPTAKSYTISIPATGHSRTYQTRAQ